MNDNKTLIAITADHSGSMSGIAAESTQAIANFIAEQKAQPGELDILLTQFDTIFNTVYGPGPVADYPGYELIPSGMTALNDGIGKTIGILGAHLAGLPEADRPGKVIFIVVTDGGENSSVEFRGEEGRKRIKSMIEHQESKYAWNVVFLASNIDSTQASRSYGITRSAQTHNTASAVGATYAGLSQTVSAFRSDRGSVTFVAPPSVDEDGNSADLNATLSAPHATRNAPANTRNPRHRSLISS